jgi:hypothetical protein
LIPQPEYYEIDIRKENFVEAGWENDNSDFYDGYGTLPLHICSTDGTTNGTIVHDPANTT